MVGNDYLKAKCSVGPVRQGWRTEKEEISCVHRSKYLSRDFSQRALWPSAPLALMRWAATPTAQMPSSASLAETPAPMWEAAAIMAAPSIKEAAIRPTQAIH